MKAEIFKAIGLLLLVSGAISGTFSLFLDWGVEKFLCGTIISAVLQIAIKWYLDRLQSVNIEEIIDQIPPNTVKMQIECAYCKTANIIDYDILKEEFECEHCKNVNSIYGRFYAARKVTPIGNMIKTEDE